MKKILIYITILFCSVLSIYAGVLSTDGSDNLLYENNLVCTYDNNGDLNLNNNIINNTGSIRIYHNGTGEQDRQLQFHPNNINDPRSTIQFYKVDGTTLASIEVHQNYTGYDGPHQDNHMTFYARTGAGSYEGGMDIFAYPDENKVRIRNGFPLDILSSIQMNNNIIDTANLTNAVFQNDVNGDNNGINNLNNIEFVNNGSSNSDYGITKTSGGRLDIYTQTNPGNVFERNIARFDETANLTSIYTGMLIDQNQDSIGLTIDSEATTTTKYGLYLPMAGATAIRTEQTGTGGGIDVNGAGVQGAGNYLLKVRTATAQINNPLVGFIQDSPSSTQPNLYLQNDGSGPDIRINPRTSAPATCTIGDFYVDTSGAYCACISTNTWENMVSTGACS